MRSVIDNTLEQLENDVWPDPGETTGLIKKIHALRKKPLKDYSIEDLRVFIGQNCSLYYLIPLAIEKLRVNILIEGDFFPGDLLKSVLDSDKSYWVQHSDNWKAVIDLFEANKYLLDSDNAFRQITKSYMAFKKNYS